MTPLDTLMQDIKNKCDNHAMLVGAGLNAEDSLRIAFGDEMANKAIELNALLEMEVMNKKLDKAINAFKELGRYNNGK